VKELVTYIGAEPVIYAIEFNKRKKKKWKQERKVEPGKDLLM
jgi:hypothetical protein